MTDWEIESAPPQLVTVITATTGRPALKKCVESVKGQIYPNVQHLILVDGREHRDRVDDVIKDFDGLDVMYLPYPTKAWGGRIYEIPSRCNPIMVLIMLCMYLTVIWPP